MGFIVDRFHSYGLHSAEGGGVQPPGWIHDFIVCAFHSCPFHSVGIWLREGGGSAPSREICVFCDFIVGSHYEMAFHSEFGGGGQGTSM